MENASALNIFSIFYTHHRIPNKHMMTINFDTITLHLSFSRYSFASKHIQCLAHYYKWYEKTWEMVVLVIIFTDFCVVFLDFVFLFDIFHLFIDSCIYINIFPIFVTILPLTIPANYRLSSQFLSVGLKVGVRVWLLQKYLFATVW